MKNATEVADWVRTQVREGMLVPGQRLVEVDMSHATGATRAVIRAALQRLNAEGLVSVEPFRGASVRRFSQREIENIYLIREALEGLAARLAAERAEDPSPLIEAQRLADDAVSGSDAQQFMAANQQWHGALLVLADNPELHSGLDRLRVPILRDLSRVFRNRAVIAAACESQRKVTAAIVARDPASAERAMRSHLHAGLAAMIAARNPVAS